MTETRRSLAIRLALLGVLLALLGLVGARSLGRVRVHQAIEAVCALDDAGEYAEAVTRSDALLSQLRDGQAALLAGCRCHALVELDRAAECLPLVASIGPDEALTRPTALAAIVVALHAGDDREAARWADVLAERFPPSRESITAEVVVRLKGESAEAAAKALEPRIRALPPEDSRSARLALADRLAKEGAIDAALAMLEPPDTADLEGWFRTRNDMLGIAGRQFELVKSFERWQSLGGDPKRLLLEYALVMETSGLLDGARDPITLYQEGIAIADPVRDRELVEAAYNRLIGIHMISRKPDLALDVFMEARERGFNVTFSSDELQRMAVDGAGKVAGEGRMRFRLPRFDAGDTLFVAPADAAPADSPYARIVLDRAELELTRAAGDTPVRWVWADSAGRALASGASWPSPDRPAVIAVDERPPPANRAAPYVRTLAPADGKPNLYVVILDCADWRITRYLQARGEMPTLDALEALGTAGALTSVPAMTGTAMEKLVHPQPESSFTFLGYLHHMGAELGGLSSVGKNPIEGISWFLKEYPYIFDVLADAGRVSANMLFSHGGKVSVGRNAELIGPKEKRETLGGMTWRRDLSVAELAALPGLTDAPDYVLDMAAEFDAGVKLIQRRDIDLLLLRIEPLDLMTHAHYGETARAGRDDGDRLLYHTYRYVDQRVGDIARALDADDTLIVMSDHGIQATMLHDPEAMFIAVGPRVPVGRLDGSPEIAGVARLLLDILGVQAPSAWPDTGLGKILQ